MRTFVGFAYSLVALLVLVLATPHAAKASDFYAGKTIDFIVGTDVGGGLDTYARAVARHLPDFLPGSPTVVVRNMPGAGSGRAAAYIYNFAPKDGTAIGALFPGLIVDPLLEQRSIAQFDPTHFIYLGSADSDARVCITAANSKIKTFEQTITEKTVIGATQPGASTNDYAFLHRNATGARFAIVSGYKGTAEVLLALERGEIDGVCGLDWSSLKTQKPDWIQKKSINILIQDAPEPNSELRSLNVPELDSFVKSDLDRQAIDLIVSQQIFSRPYVAPPALPAEPAELLKSAFDGVFHDPKFLQDAENARLSVHSSSAEKVRQAVAALYGASADLVQRARRLMRSSEN